MKRAFSLLLCAALCLCLTACGGNGNDGGKQDYQAHDDYDYERIIELLEQHNYTGAVDYINRLAYDYAAENKQNNPSDSPLIAALYGDWEPSYTQEGAEPSPNFSFKEDGTCTFDGQSYLWQVDPNMSPDETHLWIDVADGATVVCNFTVSYNDSGSLYGYADKTGSDSLGNYFNRAHYDEVKLTPENWSDYFDQEVKHSFGKNSFDEVNSLSVIQRWKLKEEFFTRLFRQPSDVAIEYTYVTGDQSIEYDLSAQTFRLKDGYEVDVDYQTKKPKVKTSNYHLGTYDERYTTDPNDHFFGYEYCSNSGSTNDDGKQYLTFWYSDVKLTRVQGSLFLLKDEFKKPAKE